MGGQGSGTLTGYRRKPIWINIVGVLFLLAPLCNHIVSLAVLQVPGWYKPTVWLTWVSFVASESWLISVLVMLSGICLLFVRRWAWLLAISTVAVIFLYSLIRFKLFWKMGPAFLIVAMLSTLGVLIVLYSSRFRQPYLNPRIRWWETSPRYRTNIAVAVLDYPHPAVLMDVSRSGALLEWEKADNVPDLSGDIIINLRDNLTLPCKVVRKTTLGYGIQFLKLDGEEKRGLLNFLNVLVTDPTLLRR